MAIAALIVAVISFIATVVIAVWQTRHSRAAVQQEQEDRQAELELVREQLRREDQARQEQLRARLVATRGTIAGGVVAWETTIDLMNVGAAAAFNVSVRLVDEEGNYVTQAALLDGALLPNAPAVAALVLVPRGMQRRLYPLVVWSDGRGLNQEARLDVPFDIQP